MRMITLYQSRQEKENGLGTSNQGYIDREYFKQYVTLQGLTPEKVAVIILNF